jgi:7-cyano-7-deazaguanine synthase
MSLPEEKDEYQIAAEKQADSELPWNNPDHDVMADLREFKRREHAIGWPPRYWIPPEGNIMILADTVPSLRPPDSLAIVSGGLDSTTMVYGMLNQGYVPHLLSFDYGQRHKKELIFARDTAHRLGLYFDVVDLTGITHLISNSALTGQWKPPGQLGDMFADKVEVPDGHYAEETMKATVVPNRNMIMLSIAAGVAVNNEYRTIGFGVHSGDHFIYPDCRPRFVRAANAAIVIGNEGFGPIGPQPESAQPSEFIYTPFLYQTKADIALRALELGVPLHLTWSCYKGHDKHCGRCGTCVERLEAIDEACTRLGLAGEGRIADQTEYEDTEYWRAAVAKAKEV